MYTIVFTSEYTTNSRNEALPRLPEMAAPALMMAGPNHKKG